MSTHPLAVPEIVCLGVPDDERVWVPQEPNVYFRPLMLNRITGGWCNLLRVRKSGILSSTPPPRSGAWVGLKGSWRYLEHDWTAQPGSYVFEPPGETHTLVVDDDVPEMITFFNISGGMYYVDALGNNTGFEDVFKKIDMCRTHYEKVGLGAQFVDQFIR